MSGRSALSLGLVVVFALSIAAQTPASPAAGPPATKSALITGRVVDANGSPVGAAVVALSGRPQPSAQDPRVLTDGEGRFFFSELAAGSYTLTANKPRWTPGAFGRTRPGGSSLTVDLSDGERRGDIAIAIWRYAVVSGRVTDDAGDPMVDVDVRAFQQVFYAGRRQMTFAARARTDDRGIFRFASLLPGEYVIVVPATVTTEPAGFAGAIRAAGETPRPYLQTMTAVGTAPMMFDRAETPSASDRLVSSILAMPRPPGSGDDAWLTYPTTFFPSATVLGSAATVRAESGGERSGIEVTLRLTPTYQVSGTLLGPEGAAAYHAVHLLPADSANTPLVDTATAITDAAGAFTFYGVPPGQFIARVVRTPWPTGGQRLGIAGGTGAIRSVMAFSDGPSTGPPPIPTEPLLYVDHPISVAGRHVRDVTLTMRTGPRVTGRLEFEGSAERPTATQWQAMAVLVEPAGGQQYQGVRPGQISADGQFATPGVPPGRYLIRVGAPSGWTFKAAMHQGRDISESPVEMTSDLDDVVLLFTDRVTRIDGTVDDAEGRRGTRTTVLLFPTDAAKWVDYGRSSLLVRNVPVSPDGKFTLRAVRPGEYFLIAIPEAQASNWQDPAVLRKMRRSLTESKCEKGKR